MKKAPKLRLLTSTANGSTFKEKLYRVNLNRFASKQVDRLPLEIKERLYSWISDVENQGLYEVRKISGYHDEPLKGKRSGERSVRLNRAWRVIYKESENKHLVIVMVLEVNKHEY